MTERFGDAAARSFGVAASLLGWRPDEFWNATPAELVAVLERHCGSFEVVEPDRMAELRRRFPDE